MALSQPDLSKCFTFSVYANGNEKNYLRLFVKDSQIKGYIKYDDKFLLIDQLANLKAAGDFNENYVVTYDGRDIVDNGSFCGVTKEMEAAFKSERKAFIDTSVIQNKTLSSTCNKFVEIATYADYEFYQVYGASANNEILAKMNMVDGIYTETFGLHLFVSHQNVWTTMSDPYTGDITSDLGSDILLNELRNYWEANMSTVDRDIVHLFSHRDPYLPGVSGKAYLGTVCRYRDKSYGFTRVVSNYFTVTAHEIGHNFAGLHEDGQNCRTVNASVMCQFEKQVPMYFSTAEISRISSYVSSYSSCLRPYINVPHGPKCSPTVFDISGAPSSASVTWSASPAGIVTLSPSGQTVTVTPISLASSTVTLTADVIVDCGNYVTTMELHIGPPKGAMLRVGGDTRVPRNPGEGHYEAMYGFIPLCGLNVPPVNIEEVEWSVSTGEAVDTLFGSSYCSGSVVTGGGAVINFSTLGTRYIYLRAKNACGWSDLSPGFMVEVYEWFLREVFPNPADGHIVVSLRDKPSENERHVKSSEVLDVKLFNQQGELLRSGRSENGTIKFDTQKLLEGTFFLHIKKGNELVKRQIKIIH